MTNKKEGFIIDKTGQTMWENKPWSRLPDGSPSDDETREAFKIKPNKKEEQDD